jgi:hypothetical protein
MGDVMSADVYKVVELLGHEEDCYSLRPEHDWMHSECTHDDSGCGVWMTARLILTSDNVNKLLAAAWERGFLACQIRVGNELLKLLPNGVDASNPYRPKVD